MFGHIDRQQLTRLQLLLVGQRKALLRASRMEAAPEMILVSTPPDRICSAQGRNTCVPASNDHWAD